MSQSIENYVSEMELRFPDSYLIINPGFRKNVKVSRLNN